MDSQCKGFKLHKKAASKHSIAEDNEGDHRWIDFNKVELQMGGLKENKNIGLDVYT